MSNEAHTPAPWRSVTDGISHWIEIQPNKIALIRAKKADRDLIVAAPDMLAALHEVLSLCDRDSDIGRVVIAAIAKAKGE
jgi:hypothetical protein